MITHDYIFSNQICKLVQDKKPLSIHIFNTSIFLSDVELFFSENFSKMKGHLRSQNNHIFKIFNFSHLKISLVTDTLVND